MSSGRRSDLIELLVGEHYRAGLICEGRVGSGRLLVCTLRVLEGMERRFPEAGYLLDCLVDYALSENFHTTTQAMTVDEARHVFAAR